MHFSSLACLFDAWLFQLFASGQYSGPRRLYNWIPDPDFVALLGLLASPLPSSLSTLPPIQKPKPKHTNPELCYLRLVISKGTSPIVARIILSPFWYQNVSLFCPLLKIQRSMVWAGTATIQRIRRILPSLLSGPHTRCQHSTMSLLFHVGARRVFGWWTCVPHMDLKCIHVVRNRLVLVNRSF